MVTQIFSCPTELWWLTNTLIFIMISKNKCFLCEKKHPFVFGLDARAAVEAAKATVVARRQSRASLVSL